MNSDQDLLIKHLELWSAADSSATQGRGRSALDSLNSYGIKKLRTLILDLAVRGRLSLRKSVWTIGKLSDLGDWAVGSGFPSSEQGLNNAEIFFVKVGDMNLMGNEKFILSANNTISEETANRLRVNVHPPGTVIFPKIGGAIATNKRRILTKKTAIDNNCLGIVPANEISPEWVFLQLSSMDLSKYQVGTSVPALSQGVLGAIPIFIPSLPEQIATIKQVDEFMSICDQLDEKNNLSSTVHCELVKKFLETLVYSNDFEEFEENWHGISDLFDTLFVTEQSIDLLRSALLELAIKGKLTCQKSSDSHATNLLFSSEANHDAETKLPNQWVSAKLEQFTLKITDGEHFRPPTQASGVYFLSAKDIRDEGVSLGSPLFISQETAAKALKRCNPEYGDVLIVSRGATVGRACMVDICEVFCLLGSVILIKPNHVLGEFLVHALKSPAIKEQLVNASGSTAQPAIYLKDLKKIAFPIPPLEEQRRIIHKMKELNSLCDELKLKISKSNQLKRKIADILVEQAVT